MDGAPLAPWDRLASFRLPVETAFPLSATGPVQVAKGDPFRTLLMFALTSPQSVSLTVGYPIPIAFYQNISVSIPIVNVSTLTVGAGVSGLFLPPTGQPIVLDAATYGPLVTQPWYATISIASTVTLTAWTVSMQDWPEAQQSQNQIQQVDNGTFTAMVNGRANRGRRAKLYGDRWRKPQAPSPYDLSVIRSAGIPEP